MTLENHQIKEPLSKFIDSIFYYSDYMPAHSIEKVVPTGNVYIVMELDGFERQTFDDHHQPTGKYTNVWISGVHKSHINISAHKNSEMLVIQFKPEGAFPFLKTEINTFSNTVIPAEEYLGQRILALREEVKKHATVADKFNIVENWLIDIFDTNLEPPPEIVALLSDLKNNPFSKHYELIGNYSKTQKHLIHQLKKYCGLTPKELHRVFRFNQVLATIHQKKNIQWTEIVYETGYSDQSHFIKEFQRFSGFNPSQYIKNKYHESAPNFFPLDKPG